MARGQPRGEGVEAQHGRLATVRPAPSSPRHALPTPMTITPVDLQREEVRSARDARVVAADGLLAARAQVLVVELHVALHEAGRT